MLLFGIFYLQNVQMPYFTQSFIFKEVEGDGMRTDAMYEVEKRQAYQQNNNILLEQMNLIQL